ncbi:MAG TPA: ATP-dependent DNA helicase [Candidatus Saccharimonadales bacterium]|nr:ATP-dependent DNA helicase [Candidatus Saccharimonadales bacterium]
MGLFEDEYERLNEAQKEAVEETEGPVLVVAGPGTGKTQLLGMRVANILKTRDTKPSNILCLTFTNKASINMKERIIRLTGVEGAKVTVKTFHSFAGEIMNLYPDYFWNAARLSVAPESVQLDIIESIVSKLPLDNPLALKFAGQYTLLGDIQRSIGLAKDAGLTPGKLSALIDVNLAYINEIEASLVEILGQRLSAKTLEELRTKVAALPKQPIDQSVYPLVSLSTVLIESLDNAIAQDEGSGKTANTSAWKQRWVQTVNGEKGMWKERQRNEWWRELANVYEVYRELVHERGFYDYADMLVEVIAQLEQHPDILADVQERFNYVLIDEFQDTTPAQLRLAHLVADHHSTDEPNLMAVGDDDQSIFKFNGAELNNMLGFERNYPSAKRIVLLKNYRSTQQVLDSAKKVIEQAESRLVNQDTSLSKDLVAEDPPEDPGRIAAVSYSSRELQFSEIAREIQSAYKPKKEIAVLARGHDSLIKMSGILQQLNVPVRYEQQSNILDHEIVNQVYLITSLLAAINSGDKATINALVHQVLRHPMWGIEPVELWQLAVDNYPRRDWLKSLLNNRSSQLQTTGNWLVWLSRQAGSQPLAVTLEHILGLRKSHEYTSPIREYFIDRNIDRNKDRAGQYLSSLSAIQLLRALVHEFARQGEPTLEELIRFIDINRENNKVVADESPFITGNQAVQLLTVHKAKGLEFDDVYIIDAIEDIWQPRKGSRKPPSNLPLQPNGDDFDDYVRLMYVAMTRARSSITISGYYQDHAGKDVAASTIIQTAFDITKLTETGEDRLIEVLEQNLHWPDLSGGEEREMLKAKLETYNLSVTHLLNFLDLSKGGPQYFKERNLLNLPEAKSVALSYGTAMHSAMEEAQKLTNKDSFDLAAIKQAFALALEEEQLSPAETKRFTEQGKQMLDRLFNEYGYTLQKGNLPEQELKDIHLGEAVISGKLDRVDKNSPSLLIADYKTGKPLSSFATSDKSKALKAHNHKMQLIFYALLAQETPQFSEYKNFEGQMVYVEADTQKLLRLSYAPSEDDVKRLRLLIEAVWKKIMALDLPDISHYSQDIDGVQQFEQDLIDGTI